MKKQIEIIRKIRTNLLSVIQGLTTEQLNTVPPGFNNNIIWNLAHLVSSQQGLCYVRPGLPITIEESYYLPYRPDTRPAQLVTANEVAVIKQLLLTSLDKLEADYDVKDFRAYQAVTTRYGIVISSIDDAINLLLFHEGLHMGYIMALKRVVMS
ncbi:MAG: DinB family protein [Sphingobacteriaceae bacterium]